MIKKQGGTLVLKFERDLRKTTNVDKKSFVLVINEFWGCVGLSFEEYCWLDLFCVMFVKRKCWVFKGNDVKILSKPLFLFWLLIKL